ncbi:MAG: DUF2157 domain-containing protein [Proteobacteria bacterium]|nr:DUF2157 domain-containing protein [Pseudomonadota bacterium]
MNSNRAYLLDWSDQGRIAPERLREAFEHAGVLPDASGWRRFLDRVLLFMGVVLLASGVIFFFAFNWQDLGRYARFALVEAPIVAGLVLVWRLGVDSISGKAAVLFVALLTGALLALVGQTYQTGADTYELFAAWALAILPWVLVARFTPLWIVWLALVNLAVSLYFSTFGLFWGMVFAPEKLLWLLFGLNTLALVIWEGCAAVGIDWLRERWSVRILATAGGGLITALGIWDVLDWRTSSHWGAPAWCAWIGAAYFMYRHWVRDVFVLAGGVLSVIVMVAVLMAKGMSSVNADGFLLIGMAVIGMSAAGGYWLKQVATGEDA